MDDEEIFTASFPAGRKQIFVDVKENNIGKYLKIKERGDSQTNSILIPGGSIVQLRNALDEAVQALGLDSGKGGGGGKRVAGNQCVCHVGNLSWETTGDTLREPRRHGLHRRQHRSWLRRRVKRVLDDTRDEHVRQVGERGRSVGIGGGHFGDQVELLAQ